MEKLIINNIKDNSENKTNTVDNKDKDINENKLINNIQENSNLVNNNNNNSYDDNDIIDINIEDLEENNNDNLKTFNINNEGIKNEVNNNDNLKTNINELKLYESQPPQSNIIKNIQPFQTSQLSLEIPLFPDHTHILNELKEKGNINEKFLISDLEKNLQNFIDARLNQMERNIIESNLSMSKQYNSVSNQTNVSKLIKSKISFEGGSNTKSQSKPLVEEAKDNSIDENLIDDYVRINKSSFTGASIKSNLVFIEDICGMCSSEIIRFKYSCVVCENLSVCEECERKHNHPMIKFKDLNIGGIEDALVFLEGFAVKEQVKKYYETGIFNKTYKLKLSVLSNVFSMRTSSNVKLLIILKNICGNEIPASTIILAKNTKDLYFESYVIRDSIPAGQQLEVFVEIGAGETPRLHDISIILYNKKTKIQYEPLRIKIDVNCDYSEDILNDKLSKCPKIICIPKEVKFYICKIVDEGLSDKHPYLIFSALKHTDYNLEKCVNYLFNMELD